MASFAKLLIQARHAAKRHGHHVAPWETSEGGHAAYTYCLHCDALLLVTHRQFSSLQTGMSGDAITVDCQTYLERSA